MSTRILLLWCMLGSSAAFAQGAAEPTRGTTSCACPSSRLLRYGKTVSLHAERGITAWLDTAKEARLLPMQRSDDGVWTSIDLPWRVSDYQGPTDYPPSRKRLVYVQKMSSEPADFYVTLWEKGKKRPSDVVLAQADVRAADADFSRDSNEKQLLALHMGPITARSSDSCGTYQTLPVVFGAESKQSEPAAFWVENVAPNGASRAALIDARHVKIFGVGRVPACAEGLFLDENTRGSISLRALSRELVLGPLWEWQLSEDEHNPLPAVLNTPPHAELDAVENPFVAGYRTPLERLLSDDTDHAALGLMVFLIIASIAAAFLIWQLWRHAKPNWVNVICPACEAEIRLDAAKKEVDGTFCPHCGGSSVFISFGADGRAKAAAFRRSENQEIQT